MIEAGPWEDDSFRGPIFSGSFSEKPPQEVSARSLLGWILQSSDCASFKFSCMISLKLERIRIKQNNLCDQEDNMKKILILLMALMMCFGFAGCGSDKDDDGTKDIADENAQEMENDAEQDKDKIERSVDAVAAELGLTGGTETLYDIIGAKEGKQYNDGNVEIYCFDKDSDKYKAIEEGNGAIKATAVNDGVIIITDDEDMAKKFKSLKFK